MAIAPANDLAIVRNLATQCLNGDASRIEIWGEPLQQLQLKDMDSDDLMGIIATELGDGHCIDSKLTRKYHPGTMSDYYSIYVDKFACPVFLKLFLAADGRLHVTSFKKDNRYD